jgi:hypothetical protein
MDDLTVECPTCHGEYWLDPSELGILCCGNSIPARWIKPQQAATPPQ